MSAFERLAVIMIVRNGAHFLPDAVRSVPEAAEVVVADGASSDDTAEVARRLGALVVPQDLAAVERAAGVFDVARNTAAEQTRRPWVLHLDADERLTPELVEELAALLRGDPPEAAFEIPRINLFWGRSVRLLGSDRQRRLVRRGLGRFSGDALHLPMEVDGSIGSLEFPLLHLNVSTWRDVTRRFRTALPVEARTLGRRPAFGEAVARPLHLFRYYFWRNQAFRDGLRGLIVSAIFAVYGGAVFWAARREQRATG